MAQKKNGIIMKCTETGQETYITKKNKKNNTERLELLKYNPVLKKRTLYREKKK